MKRTALILLMVLSAAALFANGNAEAEADAPDGTAREWSRSGRAFDEDFVPPEEPVWNPVELTGTVELVDDHAVLTADGDTYLLTIPRLAWYADEVEEGSVITVRGQLTDSDVVHENVEFDGDGHILVQQVEIDGEVYVIGPGPRAAMARPWAPGGMGGPAPKGGRFGGPAFDDEYRRGAPDGPDGFGRDRFQRPSMPGGRRR